MEMKLTNILVTLLMVDAGVVLVLQLMRSPIAWVFVCVYWAILLVKNYVDWKRTNETSAVFQSWR
jgi:hypothetical protein